LFKRQELGLRGENCGENQDRGGGETWHLSIVTGREWRFRICAWISGGPDGWRRKTNHV
jgi:hypothetical protein